MHEPKTVLYEKFSSVLFEVKGNLTNIDQVNGFLREFRREFEATKIREGELFIRTSDVSSFACRRDAKDTLTCSQEIKWTISDAYEGSADRANHKINPLIDRKLKEIKRTYPGMEARVLASNFPGQMKSEIWPFERVESISF